MSMKDAGTELQREKIAVVLIHGIGDISPGGVLASAVRAIRRAMGDAGEVQQPPPETIPILNNTQACVDFVRLTWRDTLIDVVEFHWANVTGKIRLRRPLDAANKILNLVRNFPAIGVCPATPKWMQRFASSAGWIQKWLLILTALIFTGSLLELFLQPNITIVDVREGRGGTLNQTFLNPIHSVAFRYPTHVYAWGAVLTSFILLPYGLLGLCMFVLVEIMLIRVLLGFLPALFGRNRSPSYFGLILSTTLTSFVLCTLIFFTMAIIWALFAMYIPFVHAEMVFYYLGEEFSLFSTALSLDGLLAVVLGILALLLYVCILAANLMRDVAHYLSSAALNSPDSDSRRIQRALWSLIEELGAMESQRIVLVAHSLGSVIVTEMLRDRIQTPTKTYLRFDLVTAGSPLRRAINRLLTYRLPRPSVLCEEFMNSPTFTVERWFNVYRIGDYVGQALTYSALPLDLFLTRRCTPGKTTIQDSLLKPRYRFPWGHANYWADPRFLRFAAEIVVVPLLLERQPPRLRPQSNPNSNVG